MSFLSNPVNMQVVGEELQIAIYKDSFEDGEDERVLAITKPQARLIAEYIQDEFLKLDV